MKHLGWVAVASVAAVAFKTSAEDVFSDWQADDGVWSGNFGDVAHWTAGLPQVADSGVVSGYLIQDVNADYCVTNESARTVPYLRLRNSGTGWLRFVIEKPLTIEPPQSFTRKTSLPGQAEKTETAYGRSIDLDKHVEIVIPANSSLVWNQTTPDDAKSGGPYVTGGSKLTVDGGSFELHNQEYNKKRLYVTGSASATTTVSVVNGGKYVVDAKTANGISVMNYFSDYVRMCFNDGVFESNGHIGSLGANGGPTFEFSGASAYRYTGTGNVILFGTGHTVFSDSAVFSNACPTTSSAPILMIAPSETNRTARVDFRDHASAAFSASLDKVQCNNGLKIGNQQDAAIGSRTFFNFDSDGFCIVGYGAQVGIDNGYAEWNMTRGFTRIFGNDGLKIATDSKNNTSAAVTGIVNVAGVNTSFTCRGPQDETANGGIACGANFRAGSTDTATMRKALHHYGELNVSDGAVISNSFSCVIGAGYAKGRIRLTKGARYFGEGQFYCLIGFGGGDGTLEIDGGSFTSAFKRVAVGGYPAWYAIGNNFPSTLADARGHLSVRHGSFVDQYGESAVCNGFMGSGTIELGEGGLFTCFAVTNAANGTLKFDFGPTGTGLMTICNKPLTVHAGATLEVDARGYKGEGKWIQLVKFSGAGSGWGDAQGETGGDRFTNVVKYGNVKIEQNPSTAKTRPGIWARVMKGLTLVVK